MWAALALPKWTAPHTPGVVSISQHTLDYLYLGFMILDDEMQKTNCHFVVKNTRYSALHAILIAAGVSGDPCDTLEDMIARIKDKIDVIPRADRLLTKNDCLRGTMLVDAGIGTSPYRAHISTASRRAC